MYQKSVLCTVLLLTRSDFIHAQNIDLHIQLSIDILTVHKPEIGMRSQRYL